MENEPDLFRYNFTLKIIFIISLILVILDIIQVFIILDSIVKGYEKFSLEIFEECIKYQKIGDIFFTMFGVFTGMSATLLSYGLLSNVETFTNKFFDVYLYYNYLIFGPYLLGSCFISFYYFKFIAFTCNPHNYKQRLINFSSVVCILFSLSLSLMITICGSVAYSIKLVMESIGSSRDGNYLIGRLFWRYIFRRHFNNVNNNINNNIPINPIHLNDEM